MERVMGRVLSCLLPVLWALAISFPGMLEFDRKGWADWILYSVITVINDHQEWLKWEVSILHRMACCGHLPTTCIKL